MEGNTVKIDMLAPDRESIARAAAVLEGGRPLIFPTDTVYGIGSIAHEGSDPGEIFEIKRRERSQTLPWLVDAPDGIERFGAELPDYAVALVERFWPGPLTLVVKASGAVPPQFAGADGTIALRMPDSPVALALMRAVGAPLATTSANLHGKPAVNDSAELDPAIVPLVPLVLDAGRIEGGVPSTIVSCTGRTPTILREGFITPSAIEAAC